MTCQHCTFCEEEHCDTVSPGGFADMAVLRHYCTLHEHHVEPTYFCDNFTLETPDVTTQSERTKT